MHDGSTIHLHKLAKDWDPMDRISAINAIQRSKQNGEILTGLLYMNEDSRELHDIINTTSAPLNTLGRDILCPGNAVLEEINTRSR